MAEVAACIIGKVQDQEAAPAANTDDNQAYKPLSKDITAAIQATRPLMPASHENREQVRHRD